MKRYAESFGIEEFACSFHKRHIIRRLAGFPQILWGRQARGRTYGKSCSLTKMIEQQQLRSWLKFLYAMRLLALVIHRSFLIFS